MERKDNDYGYSIILAMIALWIWVGALAQCDSARYHNDIRKELNGIKYELNMMRYK